MRTQIKIQKKVQTLIRNPQSFQERIKNSSEEQIDNDIELLRGMIDQLDDEIVRFLQLRQRIVDLLHMIKERRNIPLKDEVREDQIKDRLIHEFPEMEETILTLYNHIFNQNTI